MPFPGSSSEHYFQELVGSRNRAESFYRQQVVDRLTPRMVDFLARQTMMIVGSVDSEGAPDVSVRFGDPGFVSAVDERTVVWPELRGNGVLTTLGNLSKAPATHLMFLDNRHRIGLHVRGDADIVDSDDMGQAYPELPTPPRTERWVKVRVRNGYVHCRKHFPRADAPIDWGTDDIAAKGGDYFGTKATRSPWDPP
jgi:predicted pyridoxine 5'-phosphate oxidase superfamily flavin-nucleotide-binding protein